jgi:Predicted xylanase/chitin deacetylase
MEPDSIEKVKRKILTTVGFKVIAYDDSLDWKDYGTTSIIKEVVQNKHLGNGSIILMHNGAKDTAKALETIIEELQERGYQIVPISQLIHTGDYRVDLEGRQFAK